MASRCRATRRARGGPLSPRAVHLLEADLAPAVPGHLRRPRPRDLHGPAAPDEHAAPGPGPAERPDLRRGRPRAGRAGLMPEGGRTARRPDRLAFRLAAARPPAAEGRRCSGRLYPSNWPTSGDDAGRQGSARRRRARGRGLDAGELAAWTHRRRARSSTSTRRSPRTESPWTSTANATPASLTPASSSAGRDHGHRRGRPRLAASTRGSSPPTPRASGRGGLPGLPHFAPKAKRVIYLFMSGGPSQLDLFDHKPMLDKLPRRGPARLGPDGPADHRDDGRPGDAAPWPRSMFKFAAARPVGRLGQRAAAAHRDDRRRHLRSSSRCTPRRSTTTRRSRSSRPAAQHRRAGRAWARGSSYGLGSENENLPAFVVLISQDRQQAGPAALRPALGQRLPAQRVTRASSSARRATRCSTSTNPPGVDSGRPPRDARRGSASCNQHRSPTRSATRRSTARIAQYEMAYRMQTQRPRADRPLEGAAATSSTSTAPTSRKPGTLRRQLPAGPPAGRARRAVHPALSTAAGTSTATCPSGIRGQCQDDGPGLPRR